MPPPPAAPTRDPLLSARPKGPPPPNRRGVAAAPPEPPELEKYAEEGDFVDWFPGADSNERPQTALVTQIQIDTKLGLNVFHPQLGYTIPQDGAYHIGHEKATIDNGSGAWRARPWNVAIRRFLLASGILVWNEAKDRLVLAPVQPAAPAVAAEPPK